MVAYKIALLLSDGAVYAVLAVGMYVAFRWVRFPDLTPDGSFVTGGVVYVLAAAAGISPVWAVVAAALAGSIAGGLTALLNAALSVPPVVAGLITATMLYSINWLMMGRPNSLVRPEHTVLGATLGESAAWQLAALIAVLAVGLVTFLHVVGNSLLGLRIRALGERPSLARELRVRGWLYALTGLVLANGVVGLAGALLVQRSFSADVNAGVGISIMGLAGMTLGLLLAKESWPLFGLMAMIALGAIAYRCVTFLALELGLPAEAFRLVSAVMLLITYAAVRGVRRDPLRGLRWS